MKSLAAKLIISLIALALFSVFLVRVGSMPAVVDFASHVFGDEVGQKVQDFGDVSDSVASGEGEIPETDFSHIGDLLNGIGVIPDKRIPSYERDAFGRAWADVDGNGCDTRNDILARDLTNISKDGACKVLSGALADPYTGKHIDFTRGTKTSSAVQIDHIVPLSYAWRAGAWQWDEQDRLLFANDPENLLAVDGPANSAKGDKGPAAWMPANGAYACQYIVDFTTVTVKYGLQMAAADKQKVEEALASC